jgi:hypothetical protein
MVKCHECGKFCKPAAWQMIYSGAIPMPDHEIYKCSDCLAARGPFAADLRIKPEFSCGLTASELNKQTRCGCE